MIRLQVRTLALIVLVLLSAFVLVMAFDFPVTVPYANVDFYTYYAGAVLFNQQQNIYSSALTGDLLNDLNLPYIPNSDYIYPPYMALALAPFVDIGGRVLAALWGFLNLAAFAISLYWLADLLTESIDVARVFWGFLLLGLVFPPTLYALSVGQVNMIVLALVIGAFRWDHHDRQRIAGIALGAAILIKVAPILLIVYFLARRRWQTTLYTVLTGALVVLITLPATLDYNVIYVRDVLPFLSTLQPHPVNQSLNGFFGRLLTDSVFADGWVSTPDLARTVTLAASAALVGWSFWAVVRSQHRHPADMPRNLSTYLLLLLISIIVSPRAWENLYVLVVAPVLLLIFGWRTSPRSVRILTAAAVALMLIQRVWAFHGESPQLSPQLAAFPLVMSLGLYGALCLCVALYRKIR